MVAIKTCLHNRHEKIRKILVMGAGLTCKEVVEEVSSEYELTAACNTKGKRRPRNSGTQ
jgi:hypothetical protein